LDVLRVRVLPCVLLLLLLLLLLPEGGDRGGGQDADGRTGVHLPVLRCVLQHRRRRGSRHQRMVVTNGKSWLGIEHLENLVMDDVRGRARPPDPWLAPRTFPWVVASALHNGSPCDM